MPNWRPFELLPYLFLTRWMMRTSSLHLFTIVCCLCVFCKLRRVSNDICSSSLIHPFIFGGTQAQLMRPRAHTTFTRAMRCGHISYCALRRGLCWRHRDATAPPYCQFSSSRDGHRCGKSGLPLHLLRSFFCLLCIARVLVRVHPTPSVISDRR